MAAPLSAQWFENPLQSKPPLPVQKKVSHVANALKVSALPLPFFDDFSHPTGGKPDTLRWDGNGGVQADNQVNPDFQPPSIGVAHFDGLNFNGVPYSPQLQLAQGNTDTLTSREIDLTGLTISSNLYLSFFYQAKGLGENPDASDGDSLVVEMLDKKGNWQNKKNIIAEPLAAFNQVTLAVNDTNFYFAGFKFRFRAVGRQSGGYDTWVVDYVYLNKNRSANNQFYKDLSPTLNPNPLLKRYAAMPYFEFFENKAANTADSVITFLNNNNNNFNFSSWTINLTNALTKEVYSSQSFGSQQINISERKRIVYKPNPAVIPDLNQPVLLKNEFQFNTGDNATFIPNIDLRQNDTIFTITPLENEFAYDDGIADYAGGINQRLGKVAIQFNVIKKRRLTGIKFYLPQIGRSLVGQTFVLCVWDDNNGKPGTPLLQKSVSIDTLNRFKLYPFSGTGDELVFVNGNFYVGWQQVATIEQLNVGLDKSRDAGQYLFFNLGGNDWTANRDTANKNSIIPLTGSFMVRPVLSDRLPTATEPDAFADFKIFPNPAQDVLNWNMDGFKSVKVSSLTGQVMLFKQHLNEKSISVGGLATGMYVVEFEIGKSKIQRKVLIYR